MWQDNVNGSAIQRNEAEWKWSKIGAIQNSKDLRPEQDDFWDILEKTQIQEKEGHIHSYIKTYLYPSQKYDKFSFLSIP